MKKKRWLIAAGIDGISIVGHATPASETKNLAVNKPVLDGYVGYHLREGRRGLDLSDWNWYMDFADKHLNKT